MHYYKKNIGDYAKKTARLSMLHHGAYTLLIDACYDRERFPTLQDAFDWLLPIDDEEKAAIEFILNRYFVKEGEIYVHNRIKEELESYKDKALKNKQIAIDREAAKKKKSTKRTRNVHEALEEREPNQEPRTTNHKPLTTTNKARPKDAQEVEQYGLEIDFIVDGQKFIDHYQAIGWKRGNTPIKDWKACLRTWKGRNKETRPQEQQHPKPVNLVELALEENRRLREGC